MSTQNRPTIVGLVSPGLFWLATSVAFGQEAPRPTGRPSNPAPASSATYSVLLMSNGTVVKGEIVDDPAGGVYRLKTRGGQVPYPKTSVKRAGQSIEDLYKYQVIALPPGDFDERMKLVKWCLAQNLTEQAREQLAEVVKLSPNDAEAAHMAANIEANAGTGKVDPAIRQTSAELLDADSDAPGSLPPGIAKRGRKEYGNVLPEILDLPRALAVRRASEFAEYIQPVLQQNCASCHNEKHEGSFQLVQVRNHKDLRNPDIARANLDAALRLVNPDDLPRSDLLAAGLVPHGPRKAAIFRGSNDPQYRKISTWVRSLLDPNAQTRKPAFADRERGDGLTQTNFAPAGTTDGFGSEKTGRAAEGDGDPSAMIRPAGAHRITNEYNDTKDFSNGKADFPAPFDLGREARERIATAPKPGNSAPRPTGKPAPARVAVATEDEGPAVQPTTAVQVAPGAVAVDLDAHPNDLPGMNQPMYPSSLSKAKAEPAAGEAGPADPAMPPLPGSTVPAVPKKKAKIDPALLDKVIRARVAKP